MGNLNLLTRPHKVAVIGARKASRKGLDAAYRLGAKFGRAATVVVSGLALGCDGAAHEGCLAARGETIAIVDSVRMTLICFFMMNELLVIAFGYAKYNRINL